MLEYPSQSGKEFFSRAAGICRLHASPRAPAPAAYRQSLLRIEPRSLFAKAPFMNENRRFENIALVGFMGTGKSTVGHLVAGMLRFDFVDTDELIERKAGRRITEIFTSEGEARFREYEKEVVQQLKAYTRTVISTGGGLVVNPENLASIKTHALVVCLWASAETILNRVGHQSHRPLLQGPDPLKKIEELLAQRGPIYKQADVLLSSQLRSPREVAQHVVHEFRAVSGKQL